MQKVIGVEVLERKNIKRENDWQVRIGKPTWQLIRMKISTTSKNYSGTPHYTPKQIQ